ncbi:MAG TPA: hypothetical protein VFC67_28900 [Prolixibacteraceae bacterium]|nr:hypothetical protein [Prolixibacteraceae bacterium]
MEAKDRIYLAFKFFMVLIYMALGVMILFFDTLPFPISKTGRTTIGIVFLIYGVYRTYTIYKAFTAKSDEEE